MPRDPEKGSEIDPSVPSVTPNPFPATAVARLAQPADEFWSIETEALKQVREHLRDYLHDALPSDKRIRGPAAKGLVLAIVGDYGTGKTHIAQEMLREIYAKNDRRLHPLYLDAPSDTFLALYRERFIQKLSKFEVLQRVEELYTEIVATDLSHSSLTATVAEKLRSGEADAEEVVQRLRLMESKFVRELGVKLKRVTERSDFGTALLLLRRPEFQSAVWEWFRGEPPDPILQERGITLHINTDAAALEAIGVMAFLFGRQGHRFILFIDELEKVFSTAASRRPDDAAVLAFKKLMEVVGKTGALLVLIGLPECLEVLPEDALQRIAAVIHPSPISAGEIEAYIVETQRRALGREALEPFTRDTVEYLSEIAGGNARRVVRLCYHAYLAAGLSGAHLTRAMLRQIAREQFELSPANDVLSEVVRVIEARGWRFERDKVFKKKPKVTVDFWLPIGEGDVGAAVLLSTSILQEADATALVERVNAIAKTQTAKVVFEAVLIVNGYLADNLRAPLEAAFAKVLTYRPRDFRDDLDATLSGIRVRLQERNRQSITQLIHERVDEIARQNISFDTQLSRLVEGQLLIPDVQRAVSAGLRAIFGQLANPSPVAEGQFPSVAVVFEKAESALKEVLPLDLFFDAIFGLPKSVAFSEIDILVDTRRRRVDITAAELMENRSLASVYFMTNALNSFRRGVFVILGNYQHAWRRSSEPDSELRRLLELLCRTFDVASREFDAGKCAYELRRTAQRSLEDLTVDDHQLRLWKFEDGPVEKAQQTIRELGRDVFYAVRRVLESPVDRADR